MVFHLQHHNIFMGWTPWEKKSEQYRINLHTSLNEGRVQMPDVLLTSLARRRRRKRKFRDFHNSNYSFSRCMFLVSLQCFFRRDLSYIIEYNHQDYGRTIRALWSQSKLYGMTQESRALLQTRMALLLAFRDMMYKYTSKRKRKTIYADANGCVESSLLWSW
jgi:hypothetical protein